MTLCRVLCDDHTGCLGIGQDQTSMLLWISNHRKKDKKVHISCDGLVTTKGYLKIVWTFLGEQWSWDLRL